MEIPVDYKLTLIPKTDHLHVIVTGKNSKKNVALYLEDVLRECKSRKYSKVLIEEHLEGPRLKLIDVFQIVSEAGNITTDRTLRSVAYIDMNAEGDLMKFAETVAVNRSLPVNVFTSLNDAEKWLLERDT